MLSIFGLSVLINSSDTLFILRELIIWFLPRHSLIFGAGVVARGRCIISFFSPPAQEKDVTQTCHSQDMMENVCSSLILGENNQSKSRTGVNLNSDSRNIFPFWISSHKLIIVKLILCFGLLSTLIMWIGPHPSTALRCLSNVVVKF